MNPLKILCRKVYIKGFYAELFTWILHNVGICIQKVKHANKKINFAWKIRNLNLGLKEAIEISSFGS